MYTKHCSAAKKKLKLKKRTGTPCVQPLKVSQFLNALPRNRLHVFQTPSMPSPRPAFSSSPAAWPAPSCCPPKWSCLKCPPAHTGPLEWLPEDVPIEEHEQKEPFTGSPRRSKSKAGFEEPAKEGKGLALKTLLQFADSWDLASAGNSAAGKKAPGRASLAGTPCSFHWAPCDAREGACGRAQ